MIEEFKLEESSAPFNMALATLFALRNILADIKNISSHPTITNELKQKLKLDLLKRFYVDCSPLLDEKVVSNYKEILKIRPKEMSILEHGEVTNKKKLIYDEDLAETIDAYLIKLQMELQKKNYYMPPKRDMTTAVSDFR